MLKVNSRFLVELRGAASSYPGGNHAMIDRLPASPTLKFHIVKTGSPT
jgi:hypothetical protein